MMKTRTIPHSRGKSCERENEEIMKNLLRNDILIHFILWICKITVRKTNILKNQTPMRLLHIISLQGYVFKLKSTSINNEWVIWPPNLQNMNEHSTVFITFKQAIIIFCKFNCSKKAKMNNKTIVILFWIFIY